MKSLLHYISFCVVCSIMVVGLIGLPSIIRSSSLSSSPYTPNPYQLAFAQQPLPSGQQQNLPFTPNEIAAGKPIPPSYTLAYKEVQCVVGEKNSPWYSTRASYEHHDSNRINLYECATFTVSDAMVYYVSAHDTTITKNNNKKSSPYTSINSMLNLGPPHKVSIPLYSQQHHIMLTDAKKQQLMQQNQPSQPLTSSGEPIQGPASGTQTSLP